MASVFVSYDRDDSSRARSIALALEKAGHAVWWDRHIAGGAQYGTEIEEALKRADAVVVLWSVTAVRSAWVRDEAAAGRDAGKLVPVRLDAAEPPMGFRQYQTIDLSGWKGAPRAGAINEVTRAIDGLAASLVRVAPLINLVESDKPEQLSRKYLLAAIAALVILLAGWMVMRMTGTPTAPTVTVAAAENNALSRELARDLFVKLGRFQAASPNALEILDSAAERSPDFTFQVSVSQSPVQAAANVALVSRSGGLVWSRDFERPQNAFSDLKQQVAVTAARVVKCASQAAMGGNNKLDQRTLKLYLNGCASLSELAWTDFRGLVPAFREVTRRAPRFEDGWGKLIETEAYVVGWETLPNTSPEVRALRADIVTARKINPRIAEAYWGEYILLGLNDIGRAAELLRRATRDNPDDPLIQGMQAGFLGRVGRLREGVQATKRVAELEPLSSESMSGYIIALTYAGQLDAALKEIENTDKLWPGNRSLIEAKFRFHARYGDPKEALQIVQSGVNPSYVHFESFLQARIDPDKGKVERALAEARAQIDQSPRGSGWLFLALAQFGRDDEIYSFLTQQPRTFVFAPEMFFRPTFRRFRQDIRFMVLMKRFGLLDYWRKSGDWPDFCFEPDLPYDCKTEAAKLGS